MKKTILAMALAGVLSIGGIFSVSAADSSTNSSTDSSTNSSSESSTDSSTKPSTESSTEAGAEAKTLSIQFTPENISDKGNVKLPLGRKVMEDAGYSFGDMLTVTIGDQTIDMPFGSSYSDVDSGCPVLICRDDERYENIADSNIHKTLKNLFGVSDLESQDLQKCTVEYLAGIGMSSEDIEALEKNLSADAEALRLAA